MLKLIKLEYKKGNITKHIRNAAIMTLVLLLFLVMTAGDAGADLASMGFHERSILNAAVELYSNMSFMVFTGIMLASFIVGEYEKGTINLMFSYPINRKKIMLSKIGAVWFFNVVALILSKLFIYGILFLLIDFFHLSTNDISANDIPFCSLMFWLDMLLSSIIMISIAHIGLPLGLKAKSSKVTVVAAILIAGFSHGNINGYTLLRNIYYYAFLIVLTVLLLFLSIYNIETKDIS